MDDKIQLKSPQEVLACISRESTLLNQYAELVGQEAKDLSSLENLVIETMCLVNCRKQELCVAIEQTEKRDDSMTKQQALNGLQKEMKKCESQARTLIRCNDELMGIRRDYASIVKNATAIADTSKTLSTKIRQLIKKIIETV